MKSKYILTACSIVLGIIGILLVFSPQETASILGIGPNQPTLLVLQITGSLYLGFGFLNWMNKNNLTGGIYGRPLIIGNLAHFLVGSLSLIKTLAKAGHHFTFMLGLAILYTVFTLGFVYLLFTTPKEVKPHANKI